ncbi:MAG: Uma2 family endonuclease [Chloroflexi bacterium]|nr:Uma2 family endonuclease [Chloroflexota bacterium]MCY3716165.1 Uma2 family endonuclease [Chloroflexota bacterium]MXX50012.1 Uma2 family endonuclease [Chloroflexota bacterium]MXX82151.1 Uma2 family endonuclease [Chloroflexota bacterium]MYA92946.1 Uma2 family endonuclease [Chloroflexota bacterium]
MTVLEQLLDTDTFLDMCLLPEYRHNEYELINGEMVEMPPPGFVHGEFAGEIYYYLRQYAKKHNLGRVTVEAGFRSADDRYLVLRPDVAFLSHDRAPKPGDRGLSAVMPDLAVEIASPSDRLAAIRAKAELYLRNGTRLVWLVFPAEQRVEVHSEGGEMQSLGAQDTLSGGDALPGFTLELARLFAL